MGRQQVTARDQGCGEARRDVLEGRLVREEIKHLGADDQVEIRRQRVVGEVEASVVDIAGASASLLSARERGLRDVGGDQATDARRQQRSEASLRTGEFHRLADRRGRQQVEGAPVFELLVR